MIFWKIWNFLYDILTKHINQLKLLKLMLNIWLNYGMCYSWCVVTKWCNVDVLLGVKTMRISFKNKFYFFYRHNKFLTDFWRLKTSENFLTKFLMTSGIRNPTKIISDVHGSQKSIYGRQKIWTIFCLKFFFDIFPVKKYLGRQKFPQKILTEFLTFSGHQKF